ncbi:thioredoxin-disulfide reductase [Candidatus Woesearchaeota archaeon]|nr:thioredoxin-disulfide reductase [Candidatus Woesearchaeota archaeon]
MEKVVILGSGIAGLTAAVYCARAELSPLVIGGPQEGGQLTLTTKVENFPGFPEGIQGPQLVQHTREQAQKFGARFATDSITSVKEISGGYELTASERTIQTQTLIIASGASARWLNVKGEEQYKGKGVTTCATCDGFFYKDKEVIVVGGGDSACEEALFLTKFCTKVTIIHRRDQLRASVIMQERVKKNDKIDIRWNNIVDQIKGDGKHVTGVDLVDVNTGEVEDFATQGVFLAIGHIPNTSFLKGLVDLNDKGYLITDRFMHTSKKGVFGAGDVQDLVYRQAITAAGSGCKAAMEAEKYLAEHD